MPATAPKPKILLAGIGNELRQDDAFGMVLAKKLKETASFEANVNVQEVGIGGIHLVQELYNEYDVLVLLDAVSWDLDAGTVSMRIVEGVTDITQMPTQEKRTFLADMHYTNPVRAMMLAKALDVLPKEVYILGCQAKETDDFAIGMSAEVEAAIPKAQELLIDWLEKYEQNFSAIKEFKE